MPSAIESSRQQILFDAANWMSVLSFKHPYPFLVDNIQYPSMACSNLTMYPVMHSLIAAITGRIIAVQSSNEHNTFIYAWSHKQCFQLSNKLSPRRTHQTIAHRRQPDNASHLQNLLSSEWILFACLCHIKCYVVTGDWREFIHFLIVANFFLVCLLLIHKSMMMMMMINLYGNKIPLSARAFPSSPPSDAILSLSLCNIYMCNVHSTLTLLSWLAKIFAHSAEKYLHTANKNKLW